MCRRFLPLAAWSIVAGVVLIGCTDAGTPSEVTVNAHNAAAHADKGYINGWFEGRDVSLRYTKSYFCAEPPESAAQSGCEIGAAAEVPPRSGSIPLIYAVVPAGLAVDPSTLSCPAGSTCINHPPMVDASRIGGSPTAGGIPHSHIIGTAQAGWHQTVNIRVFSLDIWNQIVAAKSLEKVRELQADPAIGGAGLISADTPTNIFFFIQVHPTQP